jgi:hypothetical protein
LISNYTGWDSVQDYRVPTTNKKRWFGWLVVGLVETARDLAIRNSTHNFWEIGSTLRGRQWGTTLGKGDICSMNPSLVLFFSLSFSLSLSIQTCRAEVTFATKAVTHDCQFHHHVHDKFILIISPSLTVFTPLHIDYLFLKDNYGK